jgi:hypothetical protein
MKETRCDTPFCYFRTENLIRCRNVTRKEYDRKLRNDAAPKPSEHRQAPNRSSPGNKASTSATSSAGQTSSTRPSSTDTHKASPKSSAEDSSTKSERQKLHWNHSQTKAGEPPSASSQATSPASFLNFEVHEKRGVGQPPSLKETRKRKRRLELESRNQSLEVFPAGDVSHSVHH